MSEPLRPSPTAKLCHPMSLGFIAGTLSSLVTLAVFLVVFRRPDRNTRQPSIGKGQIHQVQASEVLPTGTTPQGSAAGGRREAAEDASTEKRKTQVEWTLGLFGIVWGVWWAYVAAAVLEQTRPITIGEWAVPSSYLASVIGVYAAAFVYYFVRWSWHLCVASKEARRFLGWLILVNAGIVLFAYVLHDFGLLSMPLVTYGAVITVGWALTIQAIVLVEGG